MSEDGKNRKLALLYKIGPPYIAFKELMKVCLKSVDERLVFALTRAPLKLFMVEPMKKIVDCWNWLLSARPDLESLFLLDMIAAWHSAQQVTFGTM